MGVPGSDGDADGETPRVRLESGLYGFSGFILDSNFFLAFSASPNNGSLRRSQFLKYRFRLDPSVTPNFLTDLAFDSSGDAFRKAQETAGRRMRRYGFLLVPGLHYLDTRV